MLREKLKVKVKLFTDAADKKDEVGLKHGCFDEGSSSSVSEISV